MLKKKSTKIEMNIFVIMPFRHTPMRNKSQLTAFFDDQIKKTIEQGRFKFKYNVRRSDETFNITEQIIKDIYDADIVICDLSGKDSNPNVMYELGIRLALTNRPVILIREAHAENKTIFDISGFYVHSYDPLNYKALITHLKSKLKKIEDGSEEYVSPVLKIVKEEIPLLEKLSFSRAKGLLLIMRQSIEQVRRLFIHRLNEHAQKFESKLVFGSQFDKVHLKFEEQYDEFTKIDWKTFHWAFSSQPTIDAYLANQYLDNILHPIIVDPFSMFVISYHAHYLGTDVLSHEWNYTYIHVYLIETEIFCKMIDRVRSALQPLSEDSIWSISKDINLLQEDSNLIA